MKCHKRGDLNNGNLLSDSSGGWKSRSRHQQVWFLPRALKDNLLHASLLASGVVLTIFGIPWVIVHHSHLCLHLHMTFCVYVCVRLSSFHKDTNYIINRLRPTIIISS